MASAANPFASLINESLAPVGASDMDSDTSSDGSWTDDEPQSFKPLSTRSRAVPDRIIIKRSMTRKRINNPSSQVGMQCMLGEDGKYYYVSIDPYNPAHLKIINGLSPLLVNPTPHEFQTGALYTYIFASIITKNRGTGADVKHDPPKLYACQARNNFEFGTKHHHIFFRMALTNELDRVAQITGNDVKKMEYALYASGEIKCVAPRKLMVNFFSGTYKMKKKIKIPKKGPDNPNGEPNEIRAIRTLMQRIDPKYKIKYVPVSFITSESVPITQNQLDFLASNGIPSFRFDTENQCREMKIHVMRVKNTEKRIVGFEEMQQKYQLIMNPPPAPPPTNAYAMGSVELIAYAREHGVPVPEPSEPPKPLYDADTKMAVRQIVQAHMNANKGKSGGKKRRITLKKRKRH